jgi:hypothetical protein
MRTRRELVDAALDNLGILVPGQAPGDEAVARIDSIVDPAAATLAALGIIYFPDLGIPNPPTGGQIEDAVFLPFAAICAWEAAGGFNQADSPSLKLLALEAEKTLRLIGRPASTRQTLRTDLQLTNRRYGPAGNFTRGT